MRVCVLAARLVGMWFESICSESCYMGQRVVVVVVVAPVVMLLRKWLL